MNKYIKYIFLTLLVSISAYYGYQYFTKLGLTFSTDEAKFACTAFLLGFALSQLFAEFVVDKIKATLVAYKREFEKESIESTESSSKVKVLESKITVLEKALEDALNK